MKYKCKLKAVFNSFTYDIDDVILHYKIDGNIFYKKIEMFRTYFYKKYTRAEFLKILNEASDGEIKDMCEEVLISIKKEEIEKEKGYELNRRLKELNIEIEI